MQFINMNHFDPKTTKTVLIHDGRFHTDDMMFAAMAIVAAEKYHNRVNVKRVSEAPSEYDQNTIIGDIGLGIYDHHSNPVTNQKAEGIKDLTEEDQMPAACGLLYKEIKDILFEGDSETKSLFSCLIEIIEHCDNTSDNNTFSDSVNYLFPANEEHVDEMAEKALRYCKAIVSGFVEAHKKELSGKIWAIPKRGLRIVPGHESKQAMRYWNAVCNIKEKYQYASQDENKDVSVTSLETYGLAISVMPFNQREYWKKIIEKTDIESIQELERREIEDWPIAKKNQTNKTIVLDKYLQWGKFAKDVDALFIVLPSQRGGWTVNPIKTTTGKFRFDPQRLTEFEGCQFVANDQRFVLFDSKENAINAAYELGKEAHKMIIDEGFAAYRYIYGGIREDEKLSSIQKIIAEDIALNLYVSANIMDLNNLNVNEYQKIRIACYGNQELIHDFCVHFKQENGNMTWKKDEKVADIYTNKGYLKTMPSGAPWDAGLDEYINRKGIATFASVFPKVAIELAQRQM